MKKIIISLLVLVPLLTGCTNIDTRVTINADKSASVVSSLTYDGNLANKSDTVALTVASNYDKFLDPLYNVETDYGAKLSTITASKSIKKLPYEDLDLSSLGFKTNLPSGKFIEVKKNFLMSSYNVDLVFNFKEQAAKIERADEPILQLKPEGLTPEYYQEYGDASELEGDTEQREEFIDNLDEDTKEFVKNNAQEIKEEQKSSVLSDLKYSFSVKLPSPASYNNADSVDANVYTWKINKDKPTSIKLQYIQYNGFSIAVLILIGVGLLVFAARKILKHDAQKRIDN